MRQVYEHEPPFNQGANWFFPAGRDFTEGQSHNFTNGEVYPYTDRSVTYHMAFIGLKRLGVGQFYLVDLSDRDGNLDVYFGPRAVKGLEANFIETGASQTFELMFRFYGVAPVKNLGQGAGFPPAACSPAGYGDDGAVDLQVHEVVVDLDRHGASPPVVKPGKQ